MNSTTTSYSVPLNNTITYATTSTGTNPYLINPDCTIKLTPYTVSVQDVVKDMEELKRKNNQPIKKPSEVSCDDFKDVIEHVPNKVYEFIFYDNKHIKTVCQEEDEFDFDYAFYLAAAKHIWSKELTFEGVLKKADELRTCKKWVKRVKIAKREFFKKKEEELKKEEQDRLKKEQHKKYIEKKRRRDEKLALKADDGLKKIIAEAIKMSKEVD